MVKLTGTDFTEIENDVTSDTYGYDIIFKDAGGNQLAHEMEIYDESGNVMVAWVRVPRLSATNDTVITMHYGNSDITTATENPAGVWNSDYVGVWHFAEASGDALDSTSYGEDGTITGTPTRQSAGKFGYAYDFPTSAYVTVGDPADGHLDFNASQSFTVSVWSTMINPPQIISCRFTKADHHPAMRAINSR